MQYEEAVAANPPVAPAVAARPAAVGSVSVPLDAGVAEHIREAVASGHVLEVVVEGDLAHLTAAVDACRAAGRRLRVLGEPSPDQLPPAAAGEGWSRQEVGGRTSWLLERRPRPAAPLAVKRLLDVVAVILSLPLLVPVFAAVALAIKLSSPGPVFYRWRVVGRDGRRFTGYKFRTMRRDADSLREELVGFNEMTGPVFKMARDPRITPLGAFLRRYSVDELPQLWSVLVGDMSLVGPRPAFPEEYGRFELWQLRKLTVTPGLTCLWQVNGRNRIADFSEWARLDLEYIDRWSLWLDLRIIAKTFLSVLRGTGR